MGLQSSSLCTSPCYIPLTVCLLWPQPLWQPAKVTELGWWPLTVKSGTGSEADTIDPGLFLCFFLLFVYMLLIQRKHNTGTLHTQENLRRV